ncbi:metal-dependent hydrolase [Ideonella sp. A 288]|uniref:metal-dependent hydrolase n=1 Tax=Ideonella sp. A 288 TaxID=1962181 RepID=UPI001186A7D3|nr:metal-dependent hydrolase [Ideonella sp. A 288]
MDILAHTLWVAAGVTVLRRHRPLSGRAATAALVLAALPDLLHLLPIAAWWLFADGSFAALRGYSVATPGHEPGLPPLVQWGSHHLHCAMHSAPIAAGVTAALWAAGPGVRIALLGWWSHIVIDVFTHSAAYYAVPVLYPFTERGFDGIAWNTPWFMALNYLALAAVGAWLFLSRTTLRRR